MQKPKRYSSKKHSVVIHHTLSGPTLLFAIVHSALGRDVVYLTATGVARHDRVVNFLKAIRIRRFRFDEFDDLDAGAFNTSLGRLMRAASSEVPDLFFDQVLPLFRSGCVVPNKVTTKKIRICINYEIRSRLFVTAKMAEMAACLSRYHSHVSAFYPEPSLAKLLRSLDHLHFDRAPLSWFLSLASIGRIAIKLASMTIRRIEIASNGKAAPIAFSTDEAKPDHSPIVFFVHKGLFYGSLFRKSFIYDTNRDSPLAEWRVEHIEYEQPNDATIESYRKAGVKWRTILPTGGRASSAAAVLKTIINAKVLRILSDRHLLWVLPVLFGVYRSYSSYQRNCGLLQGTIGIVDYELIFPRVLALALQGAGVRLVAAQERLQSSYFSDFCLIMDDYIVAGRAVVSHLRDHPLSCVERFHPVGLIRSDFVKRTEKAGRKLVLVLDYLTVDDTWDDLDPLVNITSNRAFYLDIVQLAQRFPETDFLIRGKTPDWYYNPNFSDITTQIKQQPNLLVDLDYTELNRAYALASTASCVIGKQTSLIEECMAAGKTVVIHDWSPNSTRYAAKIYDYEGLPVFAFDYKSLCEKLQAALHGDDGLDPTKLKHIFSSFSTNRSVQNDFRAVILAAVENRVRDA